jgi:geranylgeranyl pyrophosphate synthase
MQLKEICRPIAKELEQVEEVLETSIKDSRNRSIIKMGNFLLKPAGKRIRPALTILSARAAIHHQVIAINHQLSKIAAAVELIHMASLVHDDVIDRANLRHSKPTVNSKWGIEVPIALGDYLYSVAFELISDCGNFDIIRCISSATKAMCEGELLQVCGRDNLNLSREKYMLIVKKKTASLFAAACRAGTLISDSQQSLQRALAEYGLNFGIAFQIADDYLDLVAEEEAIGKIPGQDIKVGEMTLPILKLWELLPKKEKKELRRLLASRKDREVLQRVRRRLFESGAASETKKEVCTLLNSAKEKIDILSCSPYKESLLNLADFIMESGFGETPR